MKIAHYAPFAPNACGLYEAARDMIVADGQSGLSSCLVDTGITVNGERRNTPGEAGKLDERGGTRVVTVTPEEALSADIIMAHTGIPDNWIVGSQSPIIWILHGRPTACFIPEQYDRGSSYTLLSKIAKWSRIKAMITFWPYHMPFWKAIIPEEKLVCFDAPPIDGDRFSPNGKKHKFKVTGEINVVFADTPREDVNPFEVIHGALEVAKRRTDVVFHFYGLPNPLKCWEVLLLQFKHLNALGDVWARKTDMEEVFRAADLVVSPHRITTRIIGEALSCGTPVIAAEGCEYATWTCDPGDPVYVDNIIELAIEEHKKHLVDVINSANDFSLNNYNKHIRTVYEGIL